MVRLVEDDEVPGLRVLEEFGAPVPAPQEITRGDDDGFGVPFATRDLPLVVSAERR